MTNQQKGFLKLSKILHEIKDRSLQSIVRKTIFSYSSNVDWVSVLREIKIQRPESIT